MPILKAEPELFPEQLFADEAQAAHTDASWWLLHTRPRQEKSLARQLFEAQVPFYLPLIAHRSLIRGRVMTSHIPLFTSYLFLLVGHDEDRIRALATKRVVKSLKVTDQQTLWRDLSQIRRLIDSGAPITPEDRLAPGMLVEIHSGPLTGLTGTIIRSASRRRFVVRVDFIQRGASVELDDYTLVRAR
jgi:transcriptional antiterminator RfaH